MFICNFFRHISNVFNLRFNILLIIGICCGNVNIKAQDIIVFKDGTITKGKVLEISESELKYKKQENLKGPIYTLSLYKVFSINYENGSIDNFDVNAKSDINVKQENIIVQPGPNNEIFKQKYSNNDINFKNKATKNKNAKSAILLYKFTDNSVLASNDLEIKVDLGWHNIDTWYNITSPQNRNISISAIEAIISVNNITEKPIYIDLSKSFYNGNQIGYHSFYEAEQTIEQKGNSNLIGIGVGLIGLSTSNSSSASLIKQQKQIICIEPHGSVVLPPHSILCSDNKMHDRYIYMSNIKDAYLDISKFSLLNEYGSLEFNQNNSPVHIGFNLNYSFNDNDSNVKEMKFGLFACKALGLPPIFNNVTSNARDTMKNLEGITDSSIIGTINFDTLSPTSYKGCGFENFLKSYILYGKYR